MMDIKEVYLQWFISFQINMSGAVKNEIMQNKVSAEELQKQIIRNF